MAAGHGCLAGFHGTENWLSPHRIPVILATIAVLSSAWVAPTWADSVTLTWTAPGEDSLFGRAARYDLRYSAQMITPENFLQADAAQDLPLPEAPGTAQSYVLGGLPTGVTCYLAIKTADQAGNWSAMSNVLSCMPQGEVQRPAVSELPLSPQDGATGLTTAPMLAWQTSSGATSYRLQVALRPDLGEPAVDQGGIAGTSFAVGGLANDSTYYWRVQASGAGGSSAWSSVWSFRTAAAPPSGISFSSPWPNPAQAVTRFAWILPVPAKVSVQAFDLSGRRVRVLLEGVHPAGPGGLEWDLRDDRGTPLPDGVYLVRARLGDTVVCRKVAVAR
jgi:hypothetical protein